MHREISTADEPFRPTIPLGLYALTALVGALLAADLWPLFAGWLRGQGVETATWPRELFGFRFALVAAVIGGARVLYSSLESLFEGKIGSDLALALACLAAIVLREPLVAAEVVFIGLAGECLEAFTFARTQNALGKLAELFPRRCWVLRDGQEVRTFTTDVLVGDRVVVKPGGRVPVDGVVTDGRSAVDASALTGESLPLDRGPGDEVLAGSVVQAGALTVEAKKVAGQTVAGQVIELTAAALKDKAPLERHADRLARYFLPAVLALTLLTFVGNVVYQMSATVPPGVPKPGFNAAARVAAYPTLAVLVVACPCALVLATPAAVLAALGRLAGTGVLIKGGSALERLAGVTAFAFDKTGTLTRGELELGDVIGLNGVAPDEVLYVAAAAEQSSEHPLGRLIVRTAAARGYTVPAVEGFQAYPGAGVLAALNGAALVVGTRRLMDERGITVPAEAAVLLDQLDAAGQTSLLVARDGVILGAVGARDQVRPEAAVVLAELRTLGLAPMALLTGDRAAVASAVAAQVPVTEVHAELLPAQKAEWVAASAGTIAFVGDGINDAPALARAGVGIAIGSGTDIAAEAGDIVMMGEPLTPLPLLVRLSRETVKIIRQNILVFAFGVNLVGVVLTGWLWPLFATSPDWYEKAPLVGVLYHQLGSLLVLLNSMRLLAFDRAATSPTFTRLWSATRAVDRWISTARLDDALHAVGHRWKAVAAALLIVGGVAWAASGLTQIGPDEVGVVRQFGRLEADLSPGLHVRWPWPVETVTRLRPDDIRTVEIGFRGEPDDRRTSTSGNRVRRPSVDELTWSSSHTPLTDEAVMVTGDGDLVVILATVRYRVGDPRKYLFGAQNPDAVMRSATEAVLREQVAGSRFLELLTVRRSELEQDALARLRLRLPESLGVRLDGITLHDLHPPREVVASYHAVAKAIQERDRVINDAEADATRTRQRAEEDAQRVTRRSQAEAHGTVEAAKADRDAFLAWQAVRAKMTPDERLALETRLTYRAAVDVLRQRDKVLIDAADVPGKRQLFLLDAELMRLVTPAGPRPGE